MRIVLALSARCRSRVSPVIRSTRTPGAGVTAYCVTTGPSIVFVSSAFTPKTLSVSISMTPVASASPVLPFLCGSGSRRFTPGKSPLTGNLIRGGFSFGIGLNDSDNGFCLARIFGSLKIDSFFSDTGWELSTSSTVPSPQSNSASAANHERTVLIPAAMQTATARTPSVRNVAPKAATPLSSAQVMNQYPTIPPAWFPICV